MRNNKFSGIFRGLKIRNHEKSQFLSYLVEAAGVFSVKKTFSRVCASYLKSAKKRNFYHEKVTHKQAKIFCFNFFRGFFGDFFPGGCHTFEGWCCG